MEFVHNIDEFISKKRLSAKSIETNNLITYKVSKKSLLPLLNFVKADENLRFTILTDLFATDFPDKKQRFEVVYSLLSLKINERVFFKVEIGEEDTIDSVASIFSASTWYEREAFDMFGIIFDGCPDMRRILTDYDFKGHPLRKDFPLTGHVQVKYDKDLEKVVYEPVSLDQEYRDFDFTSPWQGPGEYNLPDEENQVKW